MIRGGSDVRIARNVSRSLFNEFANQLSAQLLGVLSVLLNRLLAKRTAA